MNAKKCDRCGSYYDKNNNPTFALRKNQSLNDFPKIIDLCKKCTDELEEWLLAKELGESEGK